MTPKKVLPIIVIAQFFCSSSWFAVNAVIEDIMNKFGSSSYGLLANATIAIQLGFIIGTLSFALLSVADRFSPSKVFFISSHLVALLNLALLLPFIEIWGVLCSRFTVGFFLAGIYPVGMKIAADYYEKGLGKSLGYLVGALVLGTSFPHLINSFTFDFSWQSVIYTTSILTIFGGVLLVYHVPDGPYKKYGQKLKLTSVFDGFKNNDFRIAAFGYFGHMWELYTFWAFVPLMLKLHASVNNIQVLNVSFISFWVIASGSIGCIVGGYLSQSYSEKKLATGSLLLSCLCCLASPIFLYTSSTTLTIIFLVFWGMVVIADSPLFSTLTARHAPPVSKGTSITFVNCLGFTITIVSIKTISYLGELIDARFVYVLLSIGPVLGLMSLLKNKPSRIEV